MKANTNRYLLSLSAEIQSQSTRIRDLIGDKHWLTDGHQKEYLLRESLSRHSPGSTVVSRGFVVNPGSSEDCSTEQDILVVDTHSEAPVFNQGGVIVVFPRSVFAAISVKTRLTRENLTDSIKGLQSVRRVAKGSGVDPNSIWCGVFCFEEADVKNRELVYNYLDDAMHHCEVVKPLLGNDSRCPSGPNVIATSRDTFLRLDHGTLEGEAGTVTHHARGYECAGLATAEFLADLLDHVASRRGLTESQFLDFSETLSMTPLGSGNVTLVQKLP